MWHCLIGFQRNMPVRLGKKASGTPINQCVVAFHLVHYHRGACTGVLPSQPRWCEGPFLGGFPPCPNDCYLGPCAVSLGLQGVLGVIVQSCDISWTSTVRGAGCTIGPTVAAAAAVGRLGGRWQEGGSGAVDAMCMSSHGVSVAAPPNVWGGVGKGGRGERGSCRGWGHPAPTLSRQGGSGV